MLVRPEWTEIVALINIAVSIAKCYILLLILPNTQPEVDCSTLAPVPCLLMEGVNSLRLTSYFLKD